MVNHSPGLESATRPVCRCEECSQGAMDTHQCGIKLPNLEMAVIRISSADIEWRPPV
jgi:hypothetical protein